MSEPSDHDLLMRMRRGDHDAARLLHARLGQRLLAFARALVGDDPAAEDAVQQAWVHAMTCPHAQVARIRDVTAWLIVLCRNAAYSEMRSDRSRRRREHVAKIDTHDSNPISDDAQSLRIAIDRLDDPHREVILLRHVAAITFDQMSDVLSTPKSTLSSRYQAALDALRTIMHEHKEATHA